MPKPRICPFCNQKTVKDKTKTCGDTECKHKRYLSLTTHIPERICPYCNKRKIPQKGSIYRVTCGARGKYQ